MADATASTPHPALSARHSVRRWTRARAVAAVLALLLVAVLVPAVATHAGRTAVRTLLFLPEMFPGTPVRPITLVSPTPRCEEVVYAYADTQALADLCYPGGATPVGGVVFTLGVHPLDRHDPFLVRLHDGLTRTNMAVLRPQSPDLTSGRIAPREVDGMVTAFQTLQGRPEVDAGRVGLAGFSVGGALSTVAAADARIRDQVRLVFSFGAYYDAFAVLGAMSDHQIQYDGVARPWTPHHWSVHVFAEQIVLAMPDSPERDYLGAVLADADSAGPPPGPFSPLGDMVYRLLTEGDRVDGQRLLAALPPEAQDTFRRLSPATSVQDLRAPMYVMHDVGDTLIPFTESRRLMDNLPADVPHRYAEFHMFEHVMPRDPGELLGSLNEVIELYQQLYGVFFALTD
jgi:acetyl esterase/lipase